MADDAGERKRVLIATAADSSRIQWRLRPAPGELLGADTVGGTLHQVAKLMKASNKNIPTTTLVEAVRMTEDGCIEFDLLVLRWEGARERKKRIAARIKSREAGE